MSSSLPIEGSVTHVQHCQPKSIGTLGILNCTLLSVKCPLYHQRHLKCPKVSHRIPNLTVHGMDWTYLKCLVRIWNLLTTGLLGSDNSSVNLVFGCIRLGTEWEWKGEIGGLVKSCDDLSDWVSRCSCEVSSASKFASTWYNGISGMIGMDSWPADSVFECNAL